MSERLVVARDCDGFPLKRVAISTWRGLVYVANPASLDAVRIGDSLPIGFPEKDIFNYKSGVYEKMCAELAHGSEADSVAWNELGRFQMR